MPSITLNYLWLRAADNCNKAVKKTEDIIPPFLVENVLTNQDLNRAPETSLQFWHNPEQFPGNAANVLLQIASSGIKLMDLRSLPEYTREPLYIGQDTNPDALVMQDSLLWRQIDAAKLLIMMKSLPVDGQSISSDMDIADFNVRSPQVQKPLTVHGALLGARGTYNPHTQYDCMENQLIGMNDRNKLFFQEVYEDTLRVARRGVFPQNGYETLLNAFKEHRGDLPLDEIACSVSHCFKDEDANDGSNCN
jgi:hypothetical protein